MRPKTQNNHKIIHKTKSHGHLFLKQLGLVSITYLVLKYHPNNRNISVQHILTLCKWIYERSYAVFPVKPWTPEKISGMFIVSQPIRCDMELQKMTAKLRHWKVKTRCKTTSWILLQEFFNFTVFKYWNFSFSISALVSPKNRYEWHFMEKWH